MSSRYSQVCNNINKKVMKGFYVAWSIEPDLKLAWSIETALFKLFPLGTLWGQFFFVGFAFFCRTASPKAAIEWSTEKIYYECQPQKPHWKKDFISNTLQSFFLVFYRTLLLLLTPFGVIHLSCSQKMTDFTSPFPLSLLPPRAPSIHKNKQ